LLLLLLALVLVLLLLWDRPLQLALACSPPIDRIQNSAHRLWELLPLPAT
jgi:hypothetical protein